MTSSYRIVDVQHAGAPLRAGLRESGAGRGTPLVLLHGLGTDSSFFAPQLDALGADFHVVAWDVPGFGSSDPLSESARMEDLAGVLAATLEALGLRGACVVGVSFGTLVALTLAKHRPDLVARLVLAAPALGMGSRPPEERAQIRSQRIGDLHELGVAGFAQKMAPMIVAEGAAPALVEEARRLGETAKPAGFVTMVNALVNADALAIASGVPQPALVLTGRKDRLAPEGVPAQQVVKALPNASLQIIEDVGHSMPLETPQQFASMVRAFACAEGERAS